MRALHARLVGNPAVTDPAGLLRELLAWAALSSICIAPDVALPHARTMAVNRLVLAVGRSVGPLAFDPTHPAVRLVFLIGTPKQMITEYLQLVAALSRLLKKEPVRTGLLAAQTEAEFRAVLAGGTRR